MRTPSIFIGLLLVFGLALVALERAVGLSYPAELLLTGAAVGATLLLSHRYANFP